MPSTHALRRSLPGTLVILVGLTAIAYGVATTPFPTLDANDSWWIILVTVIGVAMILIGWLVVKKAFEPD